MNLFKKLKSYKNYLKEYPFHNLLGIDLKVYGNLEKKIKRSTYYGVD